MNLLRAFRACSHAAGLCLAIGSYSLVASAQVAAAEPTSQPAPREPVQTAPSAPSGGKADVAEGRNIARIEIVGVRRMTDADVLAFMKLKAGAPYRASAASSDVRSLWDAGLFDDVSVELDELAQGVILRIIVSERASVRELHFEGNDEIDDEKLAEIADTKVATILNPTSLGRSAKKIKDAYAEKGYFLAKVSYELHPEKNNEVSVTFRVVEGQAVTVRRVQFVGNHDVPESELREIMATGQTSLFAPGSGGSFRQDILERDMLMVAALYYDRGYLNVSVGTPRVMLTPDGDGVEISVPVTEGPRFKIRKLRVFESDAEGKEVEPLGGRPALRAKVRAHSGDMFQRAQLVVDIQALRTLYRDAGYANVDVDIQTEVDAATREVDLTIPIRRNQKIRIERIEIRGNAKTRDAVIRREFEIAEGEDFNETRLEVSKQRVMALGYFERADVQTEPGSSPETMKVVLDVQEKATGTFNVGAGFSSVENFIFTAQVQQQNLFGNGHSLALQIQASSLRQIGNIRFFEPYLFGSDWSLSAEGFLQQLYYPDFSKQTNGGSLTLGYGLVQPSLRLSLTGTVQRDAVDTGAQSTLFGGAPSAFATGFSRLPLANLFNAGWTVSLRPTITFDTRNNRQFPSSGLYLLASTELASRYTGSELEFFKHRLNGRFYIPLGGQTGQPGSGFVFKVNSELGLITSPNPEGVSIFNRYFLGGIMDVRGYRIRRIGARLPLSAALDPNAPPIGNGAVIGGNLQAYMNAELEFPLLDSAGIRGVVFFDAGNAWNLESQFCDTTPAPQLPKVQSPCWNGLSSMGYLRTSMGAGIRWFSPMGPLRFEWGFPLRRVAEDESYVFEFTIGNFF